MRPQELAANFANEARKACRGKHWPLRLLFWLWLVSIAFGHWRSLEYQSFLGGLNLGIHEFGHLICIPFGQFVTVLGGSLVQCLVPVISVWMFYRQEDYFAFSFSFVWLGTNLYGVARYIADARVLKLDLVSPFGGGGETIHDWNWLLHKMGWLQHEVEIALVVRVLASLSLLAGVLWGATTLYWMIRSPKKEIGDDWDMPEMKT